MNWLYRTTKSWTEDGKVHISLRLTVLGSILRVLIPVVQVVGFIILMLIPLALVVWLFKPLIIEGIYQFTLIGY